MKGFITYLFLMLVFICCSTSLSGQIMEKWEKNSYKAWVEPLNNSFRVEGYLSEIGDSLTIISGRMSQSIQYIDLKNIKEIRFRKDNAKDKGFMLGALIGFSVGAIVGLSQESSSESNKAARYNAFVNGGIFSIPGAILGGIIGNGKILIPINGNKRLAKKKLEKYKVTF